MNYYVTYFDKNYLPHGLALYDSMCKFCKPFKLIVLCVDNETFEIINSLKLKNVKILKLSDLENKELKKVKKTRTQQEYCWTLTPFSIQWAFESNPKINQITYIDADIWFMKNPKPIFDELKKSKKQILITRHGFSPEYEQSHIAGEFCVQFVIFNRKDKNIWVEWGKNCIKSCYNRPNEGLMGDQMYLEEWPKKYPLKVHISKNEKWFLAPWNATRFNYKNGIIWHFHNVKIVVNKKLEFIGLKCLNYKIPLLTKKFVYKKYFLKIKRNVSILKKVNYIVSNNYYTNTLILTKNFVKKIINKNFNFLIK